MTRHPNLAASVAARLLNRAKETGDDYQTLLTTYCLERFLYRLGTSDRRDRFIQDRRHVVAELPYRKSSEPVGPSRLALDISLPGEMDQADLVHACCFRLGRGEVATLAFDHRGLDRRASNGLGSVHPLNQLEEVRRHTAAKWRQLPCPALSLGAQGQQGVRIRGGPGRTDTRDETSHAENDYSPRVDSGVRCLQAVNAGANCAPEGASQGQAAQ